MNTTMQPLLALVQPVLETRRLVLRAFVPGDAARIQALAGDFAVADTTVSIPHPYPDGAAEKFIELVAAEYMAGKLANFAVVERATGELVGSMGFLLHPAHERGELGYWIGRPYWNRGYATEAGFAMLEFGFYMLGLLRIYAQHMTRNPASGRVLEKLGLLREGLLRRHIRRWDRYEDILIYGLLRDDYRPRVESKAAGEVASSRGETG